MAATYKFPDFFVPLNRRESAIIFCTIFSVIIRAYTLLIATHKFKPYGLLTGLARVAAGASLAIAFLQPLTGLAQEAGAASGVSPASAVGATSPVSADMQIGRAHV